MEGVGMQVETRQKQSPVHLIFSNWRKNTRSLSRNIETSGPLLVLVVPCKENPSSETVSFLGTRSGRMELWLCSFVSLDAAELRSRAFFFGRWGG